MKGNLFSENLQAHLISVDLMDVGDVRAIVANVSSGVLWAGQDYHGWNKYLLLVFQEGKTF